ncbi:MAG: serine O-acetyltransferase [Proteobacteria bacterium]|nr:serine O-acetyltransferase [Pseudomonadota bacterium]
MVFKRLKADIDAFMERDPAARSAIEVVILYQGFHAIVFYRFAHVLWNAQFKFLGRFVSQLGRWLTGIEIHPGAKIGCCFVIDHGTGVVIGETAEIGDNVTIYHDVTLGGVAPSVDSVQQVGVKRHPTLRDGVIVGSGAQILGPITVGEDARVGANAVVTTDIPAGTTAVGIPARVIMPKDKDKAREFRAYATTADGAPDPVQQVIEQMRTQLAELKDRVGELENERDLLRTELDDGTRKKGSVA